MSRHHLMIIAGEPSGDLHGSSLVQALLKKDSSLKITGIGGDLMAQQGMTLFYHIKELSAMGVTEVILQFKRIKKAFDLFRYHISVDKPDLIILIDYPGFNLRAAACAQKKNIPVLYYVTPKVWAWKKSRLQKIKQYVDHAALIFPFEEQLYKKEKIPCTFVGNPLLDYYQHQHKHQQHQHQQRQYQQQDQQQDQQRTDADNRHFVTSEMETKRHAICYSVSSEMKTEVEKENSIKKEIVVGILPGSRSSEISNLLEIMLKSCQMIQQNYKSITFIVSVSPSIQNVSEKASVFNRIIAKYNQNGMFHTIPGSPQELFSCSDLLLAASGTVTLEAAIWAVPMIIIYKVSPITSFLARRFITIPHVGLPNIVAGYEVVPELIQENATPEKISRKALSMITDPAGLDLIRQRLLMVRNRLGGAGASLRTARIAMQMLENHR